jgi:lysophospholipase L1-like esterase
MKKSILLLGDSIIDNEVYLQAGERSTHEAISDVFPDDEVHMYAVDGAVVADVPGQINGFLSKHNAREVSHILLSVGGNDALGVLPSLGLPVANSFEAFARMGGVLSAFDNQYQKLLDRLCQHFPQANLSVMSIYNGNLQQDEIPVASVQAFSAVAISMYNDVIYRNAIEKGCRVLELRSFFTDPSMYANPIEPSAKGSQAIAMKYEQLLAS